MNNGVRTCCAVIVLVATALPLCGFATEVGEPEQITIGQKFSLYSDILGENRQYWIHLPDAYGDPTNSQESYPVLYLLDGRRHFISATGVVQFMSSGINGNRQIPELIVVAIPNAGHRTLDYSPTAVTTSWTGTPLDEPVGGGGDEFLEFVEKELSKRVEADYRTTQHRTIVGHSWGGLLVAHALVHASGFFQGYIAIDPGVLWDNEVVLRRAQDKFSGTEGLMAQVYISLAGGEHEPDGEMYMTVQRFVDFLSGLDEPGLNAALEVFPEENHASLPLLSLYQGLLFVFPDNTPARKDSDEAKKSNR